MMEGCRFAEKHFWSDVRFDPSPGADGPIRLNLDLPPELDHIINKGRRKGSRPALPDGRRCALTCAAETRHEVNHIEAGMGIRRRPDDAIAGCEQGPVDRGCGSCYCGCCVSWSSKPSSGIQLATATGPPANDATDTSEKFARHILGSSAAGDHSTRAGDAAGKNPGQSCREEIRSSRSPSRC